MTRANPGQTDVMPTMAVVDNTLDYMDQASFLGLRARGRDPLIQLFWLYDHDVDLDQLRRFQRLLGQGLIGRRIERSPLPFGRHRWVAWPGPDDIEVAAPRPRSEVRQWAVEQSQKPIDPEYGPSWRLTVLPLTEGGAAVMLIASHTVADGVGGITAVAEAVEGHTRDLGYPRPGSRTKSQALKQDSRAFFRELPEVGKSLVAAARVAKKEGGAPKGKRPPATIGSHFADEVIVPSITIHIDARQWDERAKALAGSGPSLLLGFGARYGYHLGWLASDGRANLSVVLSERTPGDTRGNALTNVTFPVDPDAVTTDLSEVRAEFKAASHRLEESGNDLLGPLALTPFVPMRAVRRLESLVLREKEVGCSYLGDMDPAVIRPDGTDAAELVFLPFEQHITYGDLARMDGIFHPVLAGRVHDKVWISIGFCNAQGTTTRDDLAEVARTTLADMGLTGVVE